MGLRSEPGASRLRESAPLRIAAAALGTAVLTLAASTSAGAQSSAELSSKAEKAREQARDVAGVVDRQGEQLSEQRAEASDAAARASALAARLAEGEQRLAELGSELERARAELEEARERLRRSSAALAERLVAIYKDGRPTEIDLLLTSDGYEQLGARAEYLQRIKSADDALIARARTRRSDVSEQVDRASAARERRAKLNGELQAAREEIAAIRAEAEQRAAAIAAAQGSSRARLGELRSQADRLDRKAAREAEREAAAAATSTPSYGSPKNGWAIPEAIVMCESGGNWRALNPISGAGGAYQILPSTWRLYGGKGLPHQAPPAEQSRIAAMIWADSGPAAWECAG